jgi:predicted ABC-type ATPase
MMKNLYIVSGCNGAGKTTASYTVLPEILECREFVNADEIARGLSPFNAEGVAIEAGKLMLQRIEELLKEDVTFAIETTLASRLYVNLVKRAQRQGYRVSLLYFWLSSPELAMRRVAERVSKGGHDIPKSTITRRYASGIKNLFKLFVPLVDYWAVFDNSESPRRTVATGGLNAKTEILENVSYEKMLAYVK